MLEVRDARAEAAEQPRKRPTHPPLLGAGRQLDRLDAVGDELRVPRHRGEAEVGGGPGEGPEQVQDVRLVAGPLAPEDVGIHEHVDHLAASR
jgi:hypothetical protein